MCVSRSFRCSTLLTLSTIHVWMTCAKELHSASIAPMSSLMNPGKRQALRCAGMTGKCTAADTAIRAARTRPPVHAKTRQCDETQDAAAMATTCCGRQVYSDRRYPPALFIWLASIPCRPTGLKFADALPNIQGGLDLFCLAHGVSKTCQNHAQQFCKRRGFEIQFCAPTSTAIPTNFVHVYPTVALRRTPDNRWETCFGFRRRTAAGGAGTQRGSSGEERPPQAEPEPYPDMYPLPDGPNGAMSGHRQTRQHPTALLPPSSHLPDSNQRCGHSVVPALRPGLKLCLFANKMYSHTKYPQCCRKES
ncbi:hypothetical protein GGX14DRAFT_405376 [Mycena pura]|uniref:Uncharacterized protein n=1 Tax=Mycena pura TaxID=153505 RepID=A0AAD6USH9_9AGAR|nr:hypothetical protein GGX14DRAFT_405376 [Mycena pura]